MAAQIRCFNGHPMIWGVLNCPICGACPNDEIDEPIASEGNGRAMSSKNETEKTGKEGNQSQNVVGPGPGVDQAVLTLEQHNEILLKWIANIQIINQDDRKNCSDMLTNARGAKRDAEKALKEATEPAKKEIEKIKGVFNPFIDKLDTGIKAITQAMSTWDTEQERLAREALEAAKQDEVDLNTGEVVSIITEPVAMPQKTTRSHIGSDTRQDGFNIVITNADLIPRQFCEPSLVKLRAGFRIMDEIPGAQKVPKNVYQTRRKP